MASNDDALENGGRGDTALRREAAAGRPALRGRRPSE